MTHSRIASYAAVVLATLALVVASVGAAADLAQAAGHKIGKNLVVTKSIKDGAVTGAKLKDGSLTGAKVQDGSLTGADLASGTITSAQLAPGVIPTAPGKDKVVAFAGCTTCLATGPDVLSFLQLSGYLPAGGGSELRVPVAVTLADFLVVGSLQTPGHSRSLVLGYKAPGEPTFTTVPICTVPDGDSGCDATGPITVPAGNVVIFGAVGGPGGASGTSIAISYTMRT